MNNRAIILASRPHGEPRLDDFKLVQLPVPEVREGQVLLQTLWLSLDPYMRNHMNDWHSYSSGVELNEPMKADVVSRVVASKDPDIPVGDYVLSYGFWQEYTIAHGRSVRKLDPNGPPLSTALGVLGMPGLTAYTGLLKIGHPKVDETIVVAAAAGPVGSLVGQIGKRMGCRVVGVAGTTEKCDYISSELGFDAALNHRDPHFQQALAQACPKGVDVYFENVGGLVWRAVFPLLNRFARVPVCGLISQYSALGPPPGPDRLPELMYTVVSKRLTIQGFIIDDYEPEMAEEFRRDVGEWLKKGQVKFKENIVEGLEHAPEAFMGMLKGRNFGKTLVRVAI
jgi:NADPH-dependent curcumin reductase CurA